MKGRALTKLPAPLNCQNLRANHENHQSSEPEKETEAQRGSGIAQDTQYGAGAGETTARTSDLQSHPLSTPRGEERKPLALKGGHPVSGKQGRERQSLWAGGSRPPTQAPAYSVLALAEGSTWAPPVLSLARDAIFTGFSGSVAGKKENRKDV